MIDLPPGEIVDAAAKCKEGEVATGGGPVIHGGRAPVYLQESRPAEPVQGWHHVRLAVAGAQRSSSPSSRSSSGSV